MKTIKLLIMVAAFSLLTAGCTKEYLTQEIYYENNLTTTIYTVQPQHWTKNEGENLPGAYNYLYCTVDNEDITSEVMDKGSVQAFIYYVYNTSTNEAAWTSLPFVYPIEITETDTSTGNQTTVIVSETVRCEWEEGKVTFIIQDLDGYDPEDIKTTMSIKVCVGL